MAGRSPIEALDPWIDVAAEILAVPQHDKLAIERWSTNPTIETFAEDGRTDLGVFLWSNDMYMARHGRPAIERSHDVVLMTDATVTGARVGHRPRSPAPRSWARGAAGSA